MWIELEKSDELAIGYEVFQKGVPVEVTDTRGNQLIATGDFKKSAAPKKAEKADKTEKEK